MNERKNRPQGPHGFRRQDRPQAQEPVEENEGQLEGRNAIQEALKSGRTIDKLFVASGDTDKGLQRLAAQAKEAGAVVVPVDRRKLEAPCPSPGPIRVSLPCAPPMTTTPSTTFWQKPPPGGKHPSLSSATSCQTLTTWGLFSAPPSAPEPTGSSSPSAGASGLTATVAKASAGAMEYMKVARVTNINNAIAELKDKGVWIFGTAAEGSIPMYQADLKGPAAIVIGNEGDGMSPLVRKNCDVTVHIPMEGKISSLNASAAASILLYEAVRQRLG